MGSVFVFEPIAPQNPLLKWRKGLDRKKIIRHSYLGMLAIRFITNCLLYAIIINITSTKGYFLGQAEKKTNQQEFRYNIVRFTMVSQQRELWSKMKTTTNIPKITIPAPQVKE